MATVYHRDQPGAPALTYSASVTGQAQYNAFKEILKATLVSGYESTPPAGWELIYEADNSLILRNGTRSGYVCFRRENTISIVTVWLALTFSGVDSDGKIIGHGVRSGTASASSLPHRLAMRALVGYSASTTWAMVADAGTFVLSLSPSSSATPVEVNGQVGAAYEPSHTLYCGDDSAGDMICMGGANISSINIASSYSGFGSAGFTCLKFPGTGLTVGENSIVVSTPGAFNAQIHESVYDFPTGTVLPEVNLSPLYWLADSAVRRLRGIAVDPILAMTFNSQASQALGGPPLTTRTMNTVLDLGDGHAYLVGRSYWRSAVTAFLTTNPEFW